MQKEFMHEIEANILDEDDTTKTFSVPSKRENLLIRVDKEVISKLENDSKFERMLKNLLKMSSKNTKKEVININKRNYRIFL
ncbi:hypothetical protein [Liquorilactobacillus mali]|uniref:Uncharacterized protein n=2 Tax=Liquorilactobacillus mali TaxID=1618 RepID=J0L4B8_9LACO|nr:hypothetical protein [Liquorilactobacillus mali]EJE98243.1 hypothetical protein LMA_07868 [Liquorilactobacillus mali KCTC 3596 = DSM 20444]KRN10477.1 hypothetical protein FD00_GL002433 [Liquorilactobacillus mali KCTC 3596 = DSM 20444]KRN34213.1 hypothetical protein IV36_GL000007 [Liquorilactobacillus mali]MDC7951843.1 hypothetical protein [Liquorilactobacillus mali]MDN7144303.1 hypothetical protein [Liquorilactobacillus mali]